MILMRKSGKSSVKRYSYDEGSRTPRDISSIPLGNGRGKIMAVENNMGLPIISWLAAPLNSYQQVVAGNNIYYVNYKNDVFFHPHYAPTGLHFFDDGLQPVVTVLPEKEEQEAKVFWCMDMQAESRSLLDDSRVLQTITKAEGFRLTTTDFVGWDQDVLYRVFRLENTSGSPRAYKLSHYMPINPFGRFTDPNAVAWREKWREQLPYNSVKWDKDYDALVFYTQKPENAPIPNWGWYYHGDPAVPNWIVLANRKADAYDCSTKPGVMDHLDAGVQGCGAACGIVDAQMSFSTGELAPGETFEVAFAIIPTEAGTDQPDQLREKILPMGSSCSDLIHHALSGWNQWLSIARIPEDAAPEERSLVRRNLCTLKVCIREDGLIAADGYVYADYFTRDVLKPARVFAKYGYQAESRQILLSLAAEISIKGIVNWSNRKIDVDAIIEKGFDEDKIPKTEKCTPDCPQEYLLAIATYFQCYPEDTDTLEKLYPMIRYLTAIRNQYANDEGLVESDDATNDDFLQWSFWRTSERDWQNGRHGLICCYFNMEWVSSLEKVAVLADRLGNTEDASTWRKWAAQTRDSIEKRFWNEQLEQYAYFYDPNPIDQYGTSGVNNPQIAYIAVDDDQGGRYVFPDPPLIHGQTIPFLSGYSRDERAYRAYRVTREQTGKLRDIFSLRKERADRASIYYQYIQAMILAKDPDVHEGIQWILHETPLTGPPERFPINRSAPLAWCTADTLLAMAYYFDKNEIPEI